MRTEMNDSWNPMLSAAVPNSNGAFSAPGRGDAGTYDEGDYWRAYDEAWKLAWFSACQDDRLQGSDSAIWADGVAHAIGLGFAKLQTAWRGEATDC